MPISNSLEVWCTTLNEEIVHSSIWVGFVKNHFAPRTFLDVLDFKLTYVEISSGISKYIRTNFDQMKNYLKYERNSSIVYQAMDQFCFAQLTNFQNTDRLYLN